MVAAFARVHVIREPALPQDSSPPSPKRTWFITGCSTGIGRALTETLLERGERVVCTARNPATLAVFAERFPNNAIVLPLDVTDAAAVERIAAQAIERTGGIDVLVNNAGYGARRRAGRSRRDRHQGRIRRQCTAPTG